ncbi:hypothetical protein GCK72_016077 [Caenorhabditis remanei]|uniref:Uncharacterized protein n=1 Tax=Caenorhabditis remanei TaxID=31234 RepID=A0A6A5GVS7_CAERE|nr:hypothetical protein GCK72_016077 [Caenorhabditis remanei]KAF1759610.1 hypothetical protein GCK72_016077 [Caenorhabditis remanei]
MLTYTFVFIFATLLLIQTHQSVPEEGGANVDTWKNSDGLNSNSDDVEYFMPSTEERESLLRDLRSLRQRFYKPRSSFPYYKGLGK